MRKALLAMIVLVSAAFAQTTPNLNLNVPTPGSAINNWGGLLNTNFLILDSALSGGRSIPALNVANPGTFTPAFSQTETVSIGGCSTQLLYPIVNLASETSAITTCVKVPVGSTQRQVDSIAGMIDDFSGSATPSVAVFGGAALEANNGRIWGGNFVAFDNGFSTNNMFGIEMDADVNNASSIPHGLLITGQWNAQPTLGYALEINLNSIPANHWPIAVQCDLGVTVATDANDACLYLQPVASGLNHPSQGLFFLSNDPSSGQHGVGVNELANGNLSLTYPGNATGALIVNGNTAGVTLNAGTGIYQSKKQVSGCTTGSSQGSVCASPITVTWPASFGDNNYSVTCTGDGAVTNLPSSPYIVSKANGSVTVNYFAITAAAASWAGVDCIAVHD